MHEVPCQRKVPFPHSHTSPNHQHTLSHTLCAPKLFQLLKCFLLGAGKIQLSCKRMNGPTRSCSVQKSPHKPWEHNGISVFCSRLLLFQGVVRTQLPPGHRSWPSFRDGTKGLWATRSPQAERNKSCTRRMVLEKRSGLSEK